MCYLKHLPGTCQTHSIDGITWSLSTVGMIPSATGCAPMTPSLKKRKGHFGFSSLVYSVFERLGPLR